ncbi:DUF2690 domain-containing protein [Streptomyces sp. NPDC059740]|uniref:DUF2690 domain-containing protein n=1 Tax=Streptomyces sp. NPDC059740 TaxID=3346926 RepID=UPI00364D5E4D
MTSAPSGAGPASTRLAAALSELRARTGLSLTALAARTPYSKSSWGRYLDGKQLAPRRAVESLCGIAEEPPARLVALWELADLEWSGRHRTSAAPSHEDPPAPAGPVEEPRDQDGTVGKRPTPGRPTRRTGFRVWALVAAGCGVAVGAALWALSLLGARAEGPAAQAVPSPLPTAACDARKCTGANPEMMGCVVSGRVHRLGPVHPTSNGARLSLVYSERCHAAWALVWKTRVGDVVTVSIPGSGSQRVEVADRYDAESPLFTPMVDGNDLTGLRACFTPGHGRHTECFRRESG